MKIYSVEFFFFFICSFVHSSIFSLFIELVVVRVGICHRIESNLFSTSFTQAIRFRITDSCSIYDCAVWMPFTQLIYSGRAIFSWERTKATLILKFIDAFLSLSFVDFNQQFSDDMTLYLSLSLSFSSNNRCAPFACTANMCPALRNVRKFYNGIHHFASFPSKCE